MDLMILKEGTTFSIGTSSDNFELKNLGSQCLFLILGI
jgi:hypothetical protein